MFHYFKFNNPYYNFHNFSYINEDTNNINVLLLKISSQYEFKKYKHIAIFLYFLLFVLKEWSVSIFNLVIGVKCYLFLVGLWFRKIELTN